MVSDYNPCAHTITILFESVVFHTKSLPEVWRHSSQAHHVFTLKVLPSSVWKLKMCRLSATNCATSNHAFVQLSKHRHFQTAKTFIFCWFIYLIMWTSTPTFQWQDYCWLCPWKMWVLVFSQMLLQTNTQPLSSATGWRVGPCSGLISWLIWVCQIKVIHDTRSSDHQINY